MGNLRTRVNKLARQLVKPPGITRIYICPTGEDGNTYLDQIWNLETGETIDFSKMGDCGEMGLKMVDGDVDRTIREYVARQRAAGVNDETLAQIEKELLRHEHD